MNVYLFELDSVRNSAAEVAAGQQALFHEIVGNGNRVVLTYNQLSDSAAFWSGLKDQDTYEAIMELCRMGYIRVSLFAGQRTAAQYILNHVRNSRKKLEDMREGNATEAKSFYFSLIPLDSSEDELLRDLENAIQFSDLQLLKEKAGEKYLFLFRYAELILMLSRSDTANHAEKIGKLKTMVDYYQLLKRVYATNGEHQQGKVGQPVVSGFRILEKIEGGMSQGDMMRRSVWYKKLEDVVFSPDVKAAEAIIDLCYNYALEDSISDVFKRYTDGDEDSFKAQFEKDMESYWGSIQRGEHVWHKEDEERKNSQVELEATAELPDWKTALGLIKRNAYYEKRSGQHHGAREKADSLQAQRRYWKKLTRRSFRNRITIALGYALAFILVSYLLDDIQEIVTSSMENGIGTLGTILLDLLSIAIFGVVSSIVFVRFNLPDILETMGSIRIGVRENRLMRLVSKEK